MHLGGNFLQRASAQHDLLRGQLDLHRNRQMRNERGKRLQRRQRANRLGGIVLGEEPVGIELARRQRRTQQRRRTEPDLAIARKFQRAILGPKAGLDLVEPRYRVIGLDLGCDAPRRVVASPLLAGWRDQRQRAFEARAARIEIQHAVEIRQQRAVAGVDVEMDAGAVAVRPLA